MTGMTLSSAAAPPATPLVAPPSPDQPVGAAAAADRPGLDSTSPRRSRLFDDARLPAFLISTIVHTLLLVVLALLTYRENVPGVR